MRRQSLITALLAGGLLASGCGAEATPEQPVSATQAERADAAEAALADRRAELRRVRRAVARERGEVDQRSRRVRARAAPTRFVRDGRLLSAADRASFRRLQRSLGGSHGLAVSAAGRGRPVEQVGSLRTGVAWSTIKVPIAMAVVAAGEGQSQAGDLTAAITASDNAAALRLWDTLGGGTAAAQATEAQLRQAGDSATRVQATRRLGPEYTPFGQSEWSLANQTRFVASMGCAPAGQEILGLMGRVVPAQRWGLGAVGRRAAFKGGWGPGSAPGQPGPYLDRQIGTLRIDGRTVAVAIASRPGDGSHGTGTANLTALARWLVSHVDARAISNSGGC